MSTVNGRLKATLVVWRQRASNRRSLRARLQWGNAVQIERDIGVVPGTLIREAYKPFWQP
ncbi:hypothetical protein [Marinobacter salicampi]|uniref:hypothetical protein n=1 Tax=Marinobacter salicampi TaxID=435907 RepID=UPI00140A4902|nr:hypothetical protein [Marinobacter salicampi]